MNYRASNFHATRPSKDVDVLLAIIKLKLKSKGEFDVFLQVGLTHTHNSHCLCKIVNEKFSTIMVIDLNTNQIFVDTITIDDMYIVYSGGITTIYNPRFIDDIIVYIKTLESRYIKSSIE